MSTKQPPWRVLRAIYEHYWAMYEPAFDTMCGIVAMRCAGVGVSREEKDRRIEAASGQSLSVTAPSSIAVIPMFGVLAPRIGAFEDISQEGTALDSFTKTYSSAMRDSNIGGTICHGDSPGGSVFGVEEAADVIYNFRGSKPNVFVGTGMAASACYWLATQFDETVASPSSEFGSVGVISRHDNMQKMLEGLGVDITYITAPKGGYKEEGNPFEPLSEEAEAHYQARVDEYYDAFVRQVARGMGVRPADVKEKFGKGRMYGAKQALGLGMVNRIGTLQGEIDRMASRLAKRSGSRAEIDVLPVVADAADAPALDAEQATPLEPISLSTQDQELLAAREHALSRLRLAGAGR